MGDLKIIKRKKRKMYVDARGGYSFVTFSGLLLGEGRVLHLYKFCEENWLVSNIIHKPLRSLLTF